MSDQPSDREHECELIRIPVPPGSNVRVTGKMEFRPLGEDTDSGCGQFHGTIVINGNTFSFEEPTQDGEPTRSIEREAISGNRDRHRIPETSQTPSSAELEACIALQLLKADHSYSERAGAALALLELATSESTVVQNLPVPAPVRPSLGRRSRGRRPRVANNRADANLLRPTGGLSSSREMLRRSLTLSSGSDSEDEVYIPRVRTAHKTLQLHANEIGRQQKPQVHATQIRDVAG